MHYFIKDGRFLFQSTEPGVWLRKRTEFQHKHECGADGQRPKISDVRERAASLLRYRNYAEAKLDLDGGEPALGVAKELHNKHTQDWLPRFGADRKGDPWLELRPEHLDELPGARQIFEAVGFDLFRKPHDLGVPFEITTQIRERGGVRGPIVPGNGSALGAIDFVLKKRRIPRPWRPTDYVGVTGNLTYYRDRIAAGIRGLDSNGPTISSSQDAFVSFVTARGIDTNPIVRLAEINNELIDLTFGTIGYEPDERYERKIERIGTVRTQLPELAESVTHLCRNIEEAYTSDYREGMLLFESARYLGWLLRIPRRLPTLLNYQDLSSLSDEIHPYAIQLAQVLDGKRIIPHSHNSAYWPPNAVVMGSRALWFSAHRPADWE